MNSIIVHTACTVKIPGYPSESFEVDDIVQPSSNYFRILQWIGYASDSGIPEVPGEPEQPPSPLYYHGEPDVTHVVVRYNVATARWEVDEDSGGGGGGDVASVNGQTGVVVLTQDSIGDGATYKQYSQTEKTKLAGIAVSATANQTDAYLLDRGNHQGTTTVSTLSDFSAAVSALVTSGISTWVGAAPGALDTLDEIAQALQDNPDVITDILTSISGKADTGHVHDASHVTSGAFSDARIPSLAIAKTTGLQSALDKRRHVVLWNPAGGGSWEARPVGGLAEFNSELYETATPPDDPNLVQNDVWYFYVAAV